MEFTLPVSKRVVEIHEPTFGEELKIVSAGAGNIEEMVYAKCEVMVPGVSREEIAAMDRRDGRALVSEVGRVWDGRPEDQEAPFETRSNGALSGSRSKIHKRPHA